MDEKYITKKEKYSFGAAGIACYLVAGITQSYLMFFLTDILIVSASFVMLLMVFSRIWDAVNDPLMGMLVDSTNTKKGKMRPYIFIGSFLISILTVILFLPLTNLSIESKMLFASVTYILFGMAYTFVEVPTLGLLSVSTPNTEERSNLLSFYVTIGSIGGLLPIGLLPIFEMLLPAKWVYFSLALFSGIVALISYLVLYKNSKERFSTDTTTVKFKEKMKIALKNTPMIQTFLMSMLAGTRYLMLPGLIYIATYVYKFGELSSGLVLIILYLIIGGGMFLGLIFSPNVYKRIGYKKTCIYSSLLGGVTMCLAFLLGLINLYIALPLLFLGGIALGSFNVLPYPMVGESLDYLEYKTGQRMEGVCFSLSSFVMKFNNAVGFIGLALGLIVFQFVEPNVSGVALEQSTFTVYGLFSMVTLIPGIGFLLSIIPMLFYKYTGEFKEEVLETLKNKL